MPDTGSTRTDLLTFFEDLNSLAGEPAGAMFVGFRRSTKDAEVNEALSEFWLRRFEAAGAILERGRRRGEVDRDADTDLALFLLGGLIHIHVTTSAPGWNSSRWLRRSTSSHSRVMAELSERMWDLSDFFINTVGAKPPMADAVGECNHDHDVIREAIRTRNAEVARVAMERHIIGTVDLFGRRADETAEGT